jgi:hypothetical protein
MRLGQPIAHFRVEDGQPKAVPLPYKVKPLVLKPVVAGEIARLLSAPGSANIFASLASPELSGGLAAAALRAASSPPTYLKPADGSGIPGAAPIPEYSPTDWNSFLIVGKSALGARLVSSALGQYAGIATPSPFLTPQKPAPLDPTRWRSPLPSEALKPGELQPLSPGLWLRIVSPTSLANSSHALAAAQLGLGVLPPLGVNVPIAPQLNAWLDGGTAVLAIAEIVQETANPTLRGVNRLLYYMKRLLYVAKFISDVAPVSPTVQHTFTVVGLIVKGTDELHSVKITASRSQKPS